MPESEKTSDSVAAQLARMEIQMTSLAEKVEDIKVNVTQIAKLDKTIAEVVIHNGHARENIDQLWKQVAESRQKHELAITRIADVEKKTDEAINKAKGAGWVIGIVFGTVQVLVVSSMAWVFTNVQESLVINRLQNESISRIEAQIKEVSQPRAAK
jgi:regulator of replication initiation timing